MSRTSPAETKMIVFKIITQLSDGEHTCSFWNCLLFSISLSDVSLYLVFMDSKSFFKAAKTKWLCDLSLERIASALTCNLHTAYMWFVSSELNWWV